MTKFSDEQYSDEEIARRRDEVIRRMGDTPPRLHSEMKIGKRVVSFFISGTILDWPSRRGGVVPLPA